MSRSPTPVIAAAFAVAACSLTLDYSGLSDSFDASGDFDASTTDASTDSGPVDASTEGTTDASVDGVIDAGLPQSSGATPVNLYALRRVVSNYVGLALTLRRKSDNRTADFGFTASGELDLDAIKRFAAGSTLWVDHWYDQGELGNHAGPVVSDNTAGSDGGAAPASIEDQPQFLLPGDPGAPTDRPVIRFDGSRMDATSPLNGHTAQTLLTCFKPASVQAAQRLLSWHFVEIDLFPNASGSWELNDHTDAGTLRSGLGVDSSAWHTYFGRWRANTPNGLQTFRDGVLYAQQPTLTNALVFTSRSNVNIGWFRWNIGPKFRGDVRELLIFNGALSDAELTTHQAAMRRACGSPPAP